MRREVDFEEISDGSKYAKNDLVKIGCNECEGCYECCKDMDKSITLDPYDIYLLTTHLEVTFEELLQSAISLMVAKGMVIPHIQMIKDRNCCYFLSEAGRCSIHQIRPGLCRLFPLGRVYEEDGFQYFVQKDQCLKEPKTKVKVKRWLDIPSLSSYEKFVLDWYKLQTYVQNQVLELSQKGDDETIRYMNLKLIEVFFQNPYATNSSFEQQFSERMQNYRGLF